MSTSDRQSAADSTPQTGAPDGAITSRPPGRVLTSATAVAVGLLALLHAADLIQVPFRLPFTFHDLWAAVGMADTEGRGFALEAPLNLAQTAVLTALSTAALLGGLLCLGRRRGAARIGGLLAVLAVVLPLTLPLLFSPLSMVMRQAIYGSELQANLLFFGFPALVSATGLLLGLVAAILLALARPRGRRPLGRAASLVGVVLAGVFLLEALAALVRQFGEFPSWWGVGWHGLIGFGPVAGIMLCLLLVLVMTAAGLGSGLLLGSASRLTRIGGGLLAAALAARVVTQAVSWGMGYHLQIVAARMFDYTWIGLVEWTHMIAVPVLGVPGLLLAIIGLFTWRKSAPAAPAVPAETTSADAPGAPPAGSAGPAGPAAPASTSEGPSGSRPAV